MLEVLGNPLAGADPKAVITWAHLLQAVAICSTPYEAEVRFPKAWLARLRIALRRRTLATEARAFRAYQNDFLSEPDLFFTEEGRPLNAPGILAKAVFLQMHCHVEERRVWTMPVGKALWMYAAALEQLSDAVMVQENEEAELMRHLRAMQRGLVPVPDAPEENRARPKLTPALFGPG
jgi:hypothetical protein